MVQTLVVNVPIGIVSLSVVLEDRVQILIALVGLYYSKPVYNVTVHIPIYTRMLPEKVSILEIFIQNPLCFKQWEMTP